MNPKPELGTMSYNVATQHKIRALGMVQTKVRNQSYSQTLLSIRGL